MQKKIRIAINVFWFLIIAYLSFKMPLFVDDYFQSKSFATGEDISSLNMIFDSLKVSYQIFNGRVITMFFIQLMLNVPRIVFSICNAIVYIMLANLIVKYICCGVDIDKNRSTIILALVYVCMWFMMPDFAEVVVWPSGCITYMWMNLIILSFGYLYYKAFASMRCFDGSTSRKVPAGKTIIAAIGYTVLGICAGWSAEASAGATIGGISLFFIWCLLTKHNIRLEKIVGFVACLAGYCMLIFSPANRVRITDAEGGMATKGLIGTYAYRVARESYYLCIFLLVPIAISIALYIFTRNRTSTEKESVFKKVIKEVSKGQEVFFWLIAFASVYVMTFSAGFANRIFQFPLFMLIIAMGKSFMKICDDLSVEYKERLAKATITFSIIMMLLASTEVIAGSFYAKAHDSFFDRQMIYYHIYDTKGVISDSYEQD
ncbi:hypothetical protein SAMN02745247_03039 [Butyrivibrio hungatei DSM 14810]|uniref:Uncharacterized protein n=1 Tax=Butyrivibrio hungatei DSM 14810 TaxID=1121132 RepID=A0A1M7T5B9_9FIRM|nr:DUF6056 family protein [Butyrivibrio hungatei]SHN65897.1 hypothetical protein SAMN02745247_03039 [Butyrivibrio hungatei DSM 14810]